MDALRRTRGMILLTTILILGLLAALIFSMQRAMWLYTKLHQKTCAIHQVFEALEAEALKLVLSSPKTLCFSNILDVNHAALMLKAGHGCAVVENKMSYRYWVNDLGYVDKQMALAVQASVRPNAILSVRFSKTKGLMSWRYLID
ncbi:MAG: hypothetical protein K0U37_01545 [Gammaproteobacteria bacterium]|nr:hypothetical protein [Gammaproteobacteria bacterium]